MTAWPGRTLASIVRLAGAARDLVLPNVCLACEAAPGAEGGLCPGCKAEALSLASLPYCPRCGATLGPHVPTRQDGCSACPVPLPRFVELFRLGPYAGPLRAVVRQLKYRRRRLGRPGLGQMLCQAVLARCPQRSFDLVVPVAMHWRRRAARGWNHARVLARAVGKALHLPVACALVRIRNTPPQVSLPRSRRLENVRGSFAVSDRPAVRQARILLVDDVTTTGATAGEAARTLLAGGAAAVSLAVIAKAEPPTAYTGRWA